MTLSEAGLDEKERGFAAKLNMRVLSPCLCLYFTHQDVGAITITHSWKSLLAADQGSGCVSSRAWVYLGRGSAYGTGGQAYPTSLSLLLELGTL